MSKSSRSLFASAMAMVAVLGAGVTFTRAQDEEKKPEYPPLEKVTEGFEEVPLASTSSDAKKSFYRLWIDRKNNQMLAELPADNESPTHKEFIATTLSGGDVFAGLQSSDYYVYWKKYGKRLALVQEDLSIRGSDDESKSSVKRLFTDTILVDVPILTMVPQGGPVIDLDELLVNNAGVFFGPEARGGKNYLSRVERVKAFPGNVEIAWEMATGNGNLKTYHYSISAIKGTAGYKPRKADQRIGYFTTGYSDYGQYEGDDTQVRYINRWNLEKSDPKLKMSPPKQPIVFYIEHTTPIRYRRWVREGVLYWNQAFEQVGIVNAIEVRQQDKSTGLYMDLDPEDVRYNFIRWLNNNVSTAIGPSRVNPVTGEILDADIVLTDGWIRTFEDQFDELMPKIAMEGMSAETLAWFAQYPEWDPRIRLVSPGKRDFVRQSIMRQNEIQMGDFTTPMPRTRMLGDEPGDGLYNRVSQVNGGCFAAEGRRQDVALMRMALSVAMIQDDDDKEKDDDKDEEKEDESAEQILDGMPESFIGPLLADLVCHEVGHTMGLRHNFKASSIYTLAEMNSDDVKGKKPFGGSVMDYNPTNFNFEGGPVQGDYAMIGVGPYDMWAIEYGYCDDDEKLPKILERTAEPELVYATDEDTLGPDPLARRYDFSKDPLDFANSQVALARHHRGEILEKFVKDGDAWEKARKGYLLTLALQAKSTSMMAAWVGGPHINRDKKGDPNGRPPIEVVPAEQQRKALKFVIENTFQDEAYGLTPELLVHLVADNWGEGGFSDILEPAWPVHDQVMALQASALSQLMNPTTLRRVYDNELRTPAGDDALTLNELMNEINSSIWAELDGNIKGKHTEREPAISSLRRNLQAEHVQRLFDLAGAGKGSSSAMKPISNLAAKSLKDLREKLAKANVEGLDAYTSAHLTDLHDRIDRWVEGKYIPASASSAPAFFSFGREGTRNSDVSGDR